MRILYLDLDTLRPDRLGCYGCDRDTSPNIDSIANEGMRFDNYYCSDAPCLPSRSALMSGQFGIHSGIVGHDGTAADRFPEQTDRSFRDCLSGLHMINMFRGNGIRTASVSPFAERHSAWWFNAGFTETYNTGKGGMESAEEITPTALDWIERNADKDDWLLHINYWDSHTPYRAPEEFGNPFEGAADPAPWITEELFKKHHEKGGPHSAQDIYMYDGADNPQTKIYPRHIPELHSLDDVRKFFDGYDCGTRYMDSHIGQIIGKLKERGIYDDMVVIISSDHGENMGELGIYGEHGTADHATCRIPLIVRFPVKARAGASDDGLHYNIDFAPTLADLFGFDKNSAWDGESFAPAFDGKADTGRDSLVLSQCAHVCQRSVRFGPWLYMRTYHDGFHSFDKEMLFNIESDPYETENLAEKHPELCREGAARLLDWHDEMMATMPHGNTVDPLWTVMAESPCHAKPGNLPPYLQRLEKTGRKEAADEIRRIHPDGK